MMTSVYELFGALIPLVTAATRWLERQTVEKPIPTDMGFYDEERDEYVHLDKVWEETRRLQSEMAEWRQNRARADEAHKDAINLLLSNYRTLDCEIDVLKNGLAACSSMPKNSAPNFQADLSSGAEAKLESLRELCDVVAINQKLGQQDTERLFETLSLRINRVESRLAKRDGTPTAESPDVRALIRDATVDLESKISALSTSYGYLQNRLAQFEQRQSTWSKGIDMLLGRRPRG